jgi:hypothetical protein
VLSQLQCYWAIKDLTPLEDLDRAWRRADAGDRQVFLVGVHSANPITVHSATPLPKRLSRSQSWDLWTDQLREIRQHLYRLQDAGVVGKLARAWTPQTRGRYVAELRLLIDELTTLLTEIERVTDVRREQQKG